MDAEHGVVRGLPGGATDAVVTIAQNLNAKLLVLLRQLVEACEQIVQHLHQLLSRVRRRDGREAHNVRVEDANDAKEFSPFPSSHLIYLPDVLVPAHVDLLELAVGPVQILPHLDRHVLR